MDSDDTNGAEAKFRPAARGSRMNPPMLTSPILAYTWLSLSEIDTGDLHCADCGIEDISGSDSNSTIMAEATQVVYMQAVKQNGSRIVNCVKKLHLVQLPFYGLAIFYVCIYIYIYCRFLYEFPLLSL